MVYKKYNPKTIFTYADKRFSIGNVYKKLGFTEIGITKPNYQYLSQTMKPYSRISLVDEIPDSLKDIRNLVKAILGKESLN